MLGWEIQVWRQKDGGASAATLDTAALDAPHGTLLAAWLSGVPAILPFWEMARAAGEAIELQSHGYPSRYTAKAKHLLPRLPDMMAGAWELFHPLDDAAARECVPEEWLVVDAWALTGISFLTSKTAAILLIHF